MKRDLKKYLEKRCEDLDIESNEENFILILKNQLQHLEGSDCMKGVQALWMDAQKQFLKDILDDIDVNIEKVFNGKNKVATSKAQYVAYEENLKRWLHNKYHYLKRKNKG